MEMEDAEKESPGGADNVKESEDGILVAKMEPEGQKEPSVANADCQKSTEVEVKNENIVETLTEEDKQCIAETPEQKQADAKCKEVLELSNPEGIKGDQSNATMEVEDRSLTSSHAEDQKEDQSNTTAEDETKKTAYPQNAAEERNPSDDGKTGGNAVESKIEGKKASQSAEEEKSTIQNGQLPFQLPVSAIPPKKKEVVDDDNQTDKEGITKGIVDQAHNRNTEAIGNELKEPENKSILPAATLTDENINLDEKTASKVTKHELGDTSVGNKHQLATPDLPVKYSTRSGGHSGDASKNTFNDITVS